MRRLWALAAVALVLGACGGGGDDDDGADAGDSDRAEADAPAFDAVPVTLQLDDAATAATGQVGPEGAVLAATATDGTAYTLQIPPGALLEPTTITLTPLAGIGGLPGDDTIAWGASYEPSGLVLAETAWLFVTAPDVVPDAVMAFGVDRDTAIPRALAHDGIDFVMAVNHFSGSGACHLIGCGPPTWPDTGGPSGPRRPPPGAPGGPPVTPPGPGVPDREPPTSPPGPFDGGDDTTSGHAPGGAGAGESLTDGITDLETDLGDALGDLGDAQTSGDEAGEARARSRIHEIRKAAVNRAWNAAKACVKGDLAKVDEVLKWAAIAQSLEAAPGTPDDGDELGKLVEACQRFVLHASGELIYSDPAFRIGDSIEVAIPLRDQNNALVGEMDGVVKPVGYDRGVEVLELMAQGLGPLFGVNVPNDITQNDHIECSTEPATGAVSTMVVNLFDEQAAISARIVPATLDPASVTCPDPINTFPLDPFVTEVGFYQELGFPGANGTELFFDGWERGAWPSLATKAVLHRVAEGGMEVVATWQLEIRHEPGALPPRSSS